MPDNDNPWKRYREREDERAQSKPTAKGDAPVKRDIDDTRADEAATDLSNRLIDDTTSLIEQVNSLYKLYSTGVETIPPNVKRKQLETLMKQIEECPKPTPAVRFRCQNAVAHFFTYRERWDRLMRDLESGKIKRPKRS